jgi:biotin operon repressor
MVTKKKKVADSPLLEKIFDSEKRMRVLKLFLRNSETDFSVKAAAKLLKLSTAEINKHFKKLKEINFLISKRTGKGPLYFVNKSFYLYNDLKSLVIKSSPLSNTALAKKAEKLGKVKLFAISGAFLNQEGSRVDMLIVGDSLVSKKVRALLSDLEAQMGKELNYASMNTEEFKYRLDMCDRFLKDILDDPHQKLINKLKI